MSIPSSLGLRAFSYGPEDQRYYQTATFNGATTATTYIGGLFEVVSTSTTTEYRHNIIADGRIVAVHDVQGSTSAAGGRMPGATTIDQSGSASTDYLHYDHLGSVDAVTDDGGDVIQTMSFDAFGLRRDSSNWNYDLSQNTVATLKDYTDRGYTDEEELDNLSLVDMNGRMYDPTVGRFISADPFIGGDRYTYVFDNPMRSVDPSGYCSVSILGFSIGGGEDCGEQIVNDVPGLSSISNALGDIGTTVGQTLSHYGLVIQDNINTVIALVVAYETAGMCTGCDAYATGAIAGGTFAATDTPLNRGNLHQVLGATARGALIGAAAGELYNAAQVNEMDAMCSDNACIMADYEPTIGDYVQSFSGYSIAGGLTAEIAGGNFAHGAELGGLTYLAQLTYESFTGGQAASPYPGHDAITKYPGETGDNIITNNNWGPSFDVNDPNFVGLPIVVGNCFFCEGGPGSIFMDNLPIMNAAATFHDVLGDIFINAYGSYPAWFEVATYIPSYTLSALAATNTAAGAAVLATAVSLNERGGP